MDHAQAMLGVDEAVNMPEGGGEKRAEAMSVIAAMTHEMASAPHIAEWTVIGNRWEFVLDGTLRSVTTFAQRPNGFWFGHPPYTYCPWTTQEIDFITITPFLPTSAVRSNWARLKAIYR